MSATVKDTETVLHPDWHRSKMGYTFDANSERWQIDGSTTVLLSWLSSNEKREVTTGMRQALARFSEEASGYSVDALLSELRSYYRLNGSIKPTVDGLSKFLEENSTKDDQHRPGRLRAFLLEWYDWGFEGMTKEVAEFLEELTLKGNVKGAAVRARCPFTGPFSGLEQAALMDWASNAFTLGEITLKQFTLLMALMLTGRRMVQLRSLRAVDLVAREDNSGHEYVLNVPRAKQRGAEFRSLFRALPISEDLYLLLKNLATQLRSEVETAVGHKLDESLARRLPIFGQPKRIARLSGEDELRAILDSTPDFLQLTKEAAQQEMRAVRVANTAKSERTGEVIYITSRRFRYTKATNLANRGISGTALAYALDQTDTQQLEHYVMNTVEAAEYIDEVMAPVMAPMAQAFAGKLIRSERDALRANDPHSRIKNGRAKNIGNCGTHAFCASGYRSCYTCVNFQPWIDGPHHEVREEIVAEREFQKREGVSPAVISATDRLLLAVEEVIRLCADAGKAQGSADE